MLVSSSDRINVPLGPTHSPNFFSHDNILWSDAVTMYMITNIYFITVCYIRGAIRSLTPTINDVVHNTYELLIWGIRPFPV